MNYTPQEATERICPVGRTSNGHDLKCAGRDCMAWRSTFDGKQGFCGLAGDPLAVSINKHSAEFLLLQLKAAQTAGN